MSNEPFIYQWLRAGLATVLPQTRPQHNWTTFRLDRYLDLPEEQVKTFRWGRHYHYRPTVLVKPDGRERRILAPSVELKALQKTLLKNYLRKLPVHPAATAFRYRASIVSNARKHLNQALVLTVDLTDFFESTSADRVRAFFVEEGWHGESLDTLMRLCVYRNGLPQGAPTSPCLSNLVNFEMDQTLADLAQLSGARYTRYGDDLTFSWRTANVPGDFIACATDIFERYGYEVQLRKGWKVQRAESHPKITGVVLGRGSRLQAAANARWQVLKLRWQWWWRRDKQTEARLRGYEGFLKMFD
jgi:RNA-directed DNA polymerase